MATAGKEQMADDPMSEQNAPEPEEREDERSDRAPGPAPAARSLEHPGFFRVYKPGQGYWTRLGTVIAIGVLAAVTAQFIYERLSLVVVDAGGHPRTGWLLGAVGLFLAILALVAFRVLNRPRIVDFLVATESEMKKVNWTSRKELLGSTKVVILFMFLLSLILFLYDLAFGYLFKFIRVLKFGPFDLGG